MNIPLKLVQFLLTHYRYIFSMVMITRANGSGFGSEGPGPSEADICNWVKAMVSAAVGEIVSEIFETIKTKLIALFDERYIVVASTAPATATAAGSLGEKDMTYSEFSNTKPLEFDGIKDPIVDKRWISHVEGCFYTCACPVNLKFRYTHNLLRLGAKDRWNFFTKNNSPTKKRAVSWEQFLERFKADYVPPVERERFAQQYLSLKKTTESVTEITKMFIERDLFCLEYASSEQVQMSRYLSMLKTDIREFVSTINTRP